MPSVRATVLPVKLEKSDDHRLALYRHGAFSILETQYSFDIAGGKREHPDYSIGITLGTDTNAEFFEYTFFGSNNPSQCNFDAFTIGHNRVPGFPEYNTTVSGTRGMEGPMVLRTTFTPQQSGDTVYLIGGVKPTCDLKKMEDVRQSMQFFETFIDSHYE